MLSYGPTASVMQDLQHAIDLFPDTDAKAECHTERGMVYQKLHDFARAVKDLKQVCSLHKRPPPPPPLSPTTPAPCGREVYRHALLVERLPDCHVASACVY